MTRVEHEILLCCVRPGRLRELAASPEVNWEYLYLIARRHAVVPLVYRQLDQHAADLVPPDHLARLKKIISKTQHATRYSPQNFAA